MIGATHYVKFNDAATGRPLGDANFSPLDASGSEITLPFILPPDVTREISRSIVEGDDSGTFSMPRVRLQWDAFWRPDIAEAVEHSTDIIILVRAIARDLDILPDDTADSERKMSARILTTIRNGTWSEDERVALVSLMKKQYEIEKASTAVDGRPTQGVEKWIADNGVNEQHARRWLGVPNTKEIPRDRATLFAVAAFSEYGDRPGLIAEWVDGSREEANYDPHTSFAAFFWRDAGISMPIEMMERIEQSANRIRASIEKSDAKINAEHSMTTAAPRQSGPR